MEARKLYYAGLKLEEDPAICKVFDELIDDCGYFLCEKCGTPTPREESFTRCGHCYCADCVVKMLKK